MKKNKNFTCSNFEKVDICDPFLFLPLLDGEIRVIVSFEETKFADDNVVYTNSGKRISGQCICKLLYSRGIRGSNNVTYNVTKRFIGVSSVSLSDEENFSYLTGRVIAYERASRCLPHSVREKLDDYFVSDAKMNGLDLDEDLNEVQYQRQLCLSTTTIT